MNPKTSQNTASTISFGLEGRVCIVTGGAQGIGEACIRRFAREGAQLVIAARFQQSGQTVLRLESPLVVLRPENGTPAYRYLGPFLPEPVLSGPGPALVSLSWWVQTEDLTGEVFLEVSGKAFPVKSKASFDFPALPENQTVGVSFPDWKVIPGPASR